MKSSEFIKKIKKYSIIVFLLPLLTINSCFLLYQLLGSIDLYPTLNWNDKKIEIPNFSDKFETSSFLDCPSHLYYKYVVTNDNKIIEVGERLPNGTSYVKENVEQIKNLTKNKKLKSVLFKLNKNINYQCVKNHKYVYSVLNNFNFLEKILINIKSNNVGTFSQIKNPYIYGEVSISRTARYFPATLIFKPLIILTGIFLFLYWKNNLNLFNELKNNNSINQFSKKFFYFGTLACLFLIIHAILLGVDMDSKLFDKFRRLIIILFIFFELSAQIFLTKNLLKYRKQLQSLLHTLIIKIKAVFVLIVLSLTVIIFGFLILGDLDANFKHILEWNYFSVLLLYYFLSRLLWRS